MTQFVTLVEETQDDVINRLRGQSRFKAGYGVNACPRWLDKQLKFFSSTLLRDAFNIVLVLVQDTLRRADRKPFWASLLASLTIIAIVTEILEMRVLYEYETDKDMGIIEKDRKAVSDEIQLMDDKYGLLCNLFHQAYRTRAPMGFNPVQRSQDRAFLDEDSQALATKTSTLIENHRKSLLRS